MHLSDLTAIQWVGAAVAALLVGLSKAGFGTGAGLLAVPLMAAVLGPAAALPVMLLVLITGDVFSLIHYKRDHDRRSLAMLLPGLVLGVVGGYMALDWFLKLPSGELWMKREIGALSIAFVGIQLFRGARERKLGGEGAPYHPRAWHGVAMGAAAGVTSTLAHAGGPLIALFLLPQKLPKKAFVGTMIKYFFIGNVIKLLPYFASGIMTKQSGLLGLVLIPAVAAGTVLGIYLQGKFSDVAFRTAVYGLAFLAGLALLLAGPGKSAGGGAGETEGDSAAARPSHAFQSGLAAFRRSDWAAAEGEFGRAAGQPGPWLQAARFNRALALYRLGRFGAAADQFGRLQGASDALVAASAGLNAGNCAFRQERFDEAASWYARSAAACGIALAEGGNASGGDAAALREVRARADFNLTLARLHLGNPTRRAGRAAVGSQVGPPDTRAAGAASDTAPARTETVSGPAVGHAPGQMEGRRALAAVLERVTAQDTGPVLASGGPTSVVGGKGW